MKLTPEQITETIRASAFNKQGYTVNVQLKRLGYNLASFASDISDNFPLVTSENLHLIVPSFQRSCDNWSESMQISFVENIIKGHHTEIFLYNTDVHESQYINNKVLDGQHRLMAMLKFMDDKLPIFGGSLASELEDMPIIWRGLSKIAFTVLNFKDESEVIKFYIEMNENITHSKQDIIKAKTILQDIQNNA